MSLFNHIAPLFRALSSFLTSPNTFNHAENWLPGREGVIYFSQNIQVAFYNHFACRFQFFASSSFLFFTVLYCKGKCQRFLLLRKLFHMLNCVWELICHHKITNSFFSRSGGGGRRGNELQRIASNLSKNNSRDWLTFIEHSQDIDTILSAWHVVKSS